MSELIAILAIVAALIGGYWLYLRLGRGPADAGYDAIATLSGTIWILAGIFLIMGGHVLLGVVVLLLASYIVLSKGSATQRRLRRRIAG